MLNFRTGYISSQFHVIFDENFETDVSLRSGIKPSQWTYLCEHHRRFHLNDRDQIIENAKLWTESELESSTLFEVPQESNNHNAISNIINNITQLPATQTTNVTMSQSAANAEPVATSNQALTETPIINDESQPDDRDVNGNHEIESQASSIKNYLATSASNEPTTQLTVRKNKPPTALKRYQRRATIQGLPTCNPINVNTT